MLLPTVRSRCIRLWFSQGAAGDVDVEARDIAQRVLGHVSASTDPRHQLEAARYLLANTGAGGATDRSRLAATLRAMGSLLRDIVLLAAPAPPTPEVEVVNRDIRPSLEGLAKRYRPRRGVRAFGAVDQALAALDGNAGVKIVADWLVLEL
jgi:hypothetical protein